MPLTITAAIVDPAGNPLAGLDAQVCIFTLAGAAKVIVAGRSDAAGKLLLGSRWLAPSDYQPRLQLQLMRAGVFVEASENPGQFSDSACDFGQVVFNPSLPDKREASLLAEPAKSEDILADNGSSDALQARVHELESERDTLVATLTQQHAQALAAKTAERDAIAQQLAARTSEKNTLAQQLAAAVAAKTAEKDAIAQQLAQQHAAALAAKTAEADAIAQQHAAALATKQKQIESLGEQLAAATSDTAPETTIEDVARSTAEQLDRVRQTLHAGQSGLRLGKVALQLKVLPGSGGGRLSLPQTRQIEKVGAQALGSLDLAFHPEAAAPASRTQLTAPSLLGYTETFARRKLGERRLAAEVVYRLVTSAAEHGRVVFQRPAPEAPVAEGTVVLIAIGRQAEHDPRPT